MKTAERNILAVKINLFIQRFTVYIKQIRFISISGVEPINVLNELPLNLLRILSLKAIFQSLDGKYFSFYMEFQPYTVYMQNRQFHSKWFIAAFSQIYLSGNWHYYILLMFVLIFIKYTKVTEREPVKLQ